MVFSLRALAVTVAVFLCSACSAGLGVQNNQLVRSQASQQLFTSQAGATSHAGERNISTPLGLALHIPDSGWPRADCMASLNRDFEQGNPMTLCYALSSSATRFNVFAAKRGGLTHNLTRVLTREFAGIQSFVEESPPQRFETNIDGVPVVGQYVRILVDGKHHREFTAFEIAYLPCQAVFYGSIAPLSNLAIVTTGDSTRTRYSMLDETYAALRMVKLAPRSTTATNSC
jgi:hypothetical protein